MAPRASSGSSSSRGAISIPVEAPLTPTSPSQGEGKKRKRVSRACDQCFAKKDRCDGNVPVCTFCRSLGRECTYLRPERKRGPTQGLRPRLEQRIVALESVLGLLLRDVARPGELADALAGARPEDRQAWRAEWLASAVRGKLAGDPWNLDQDLGGAAADVVETKRPQRPPPAKTNDDEDEKGDEDDSDYSEVDLSLHHQSLLPLPMHMQRASRTPSPRHEFDDDEQDPTPHAHPQPASDTDRGLTMPLLSSGKGGSSLNRGLVPKGTDPNAALGGFEIQFGGNEHDEDWVRGFVIPNPHAPPAPRSTRRS